MRTPGLRLRLTILWAGIGLLVVLCLQLLTLDVLRLQVSGAIERDLAREVRDYGQAVGGATDLPQLIQASQDFLSQASDPSSGLAPLYHISFRDGTVLSNSGDLTLVQALASAPVGNGKATTAHHPKRGDLSVAGIAVRQNGQPVGEFRVGFFLATAQATVRDVIPPMIALSVLLVILGGLLTYLLMGRGLAPLRRIRETAASISEQGLGRRIGYSGPRDEVGRLAETFDSMLARLEQSFRQRQAFYALASHELRTPLTIVQGHLEVLRRSSRPSRAALRETLDIALEELTRIVEGVNDMLLLGRMLLGQLGQLEPVDLALLIKEAHRRARGLGARKWELCAPCSVIVRADREQLTRALVNLILNAIHHTKDGDRIELTCGLEDGWAQLAVRDFGRGIDPRDLPLVFDPWYRGRSEDGQGGGLGLTIVREVIHIHGGRVDVESSPGVGTRFIVRLPLVGSGLMRAADELTRNPAPSRIR